MVVDPEVLFSGDGWLMLIVVIGMNFRKLMCLFSKVVLFRWVSMKQQNHSYKYTYKSIIYKQRVVTT